MLAQRSVRCHPRDFLPEDGSGRAVRGRPRLKSGSCSGCHTGIGHPDPSQSSWRSLLPSNLEASVPQWLGFWLLQSCLSALSLSLCIQQSPVRHKARPSMPSGPHGSCPQSLKAPCGFRLWERGGYLKAPPPLNALGIALLGCLLPIPSGL